MTEKKKQRDIVPVAADAFYHLDSVLEKKDITYLKELIPELKDTWIKKQMHRTETEMRFSVLNDGAFPTDASKYWQAVREQNAHFESLMTLSLETRQTDVEIKKLLRDLETEEDELEKESILIELDAKRYRKANEELMATQRLREVKLWSIIKKECIERDPNFDTKDADTHQLESYRKIMVNKRNSLGPASDQGSTFNILAQQQTIERIIEEKEQEKLEAEKKKAITGDSTEASKG